MTFDFEHVTNRRVISNINKWRFYSEDIHAMWVADMDMLTPEPIHAALRSALEHGILGYELAGKSLLESVVARVEKLYGWKIMPEMIVPFPGVGAGMTAVVRVATLPGDGVLVQPPIFPLFMQVAVLLGRVSQKARLRRVLCNEHLHYELDLEAFEKAIDTSKAKTKLFLLCNPHNPTGRVFTRDELAAIAKVCWKHNILICSDEIHNEILLGENQHTSIAALSPAIEQNSITFIGPGKTFNMSGLHCAFAIVPNAKLRKKLAEEAVRSVLEVNSLGLVAAKAAFSGECDDWLSALKRYLKANRDFAVEFIRNELPELRATIPEGTYLLWIDCNALIKAGKIKGSPHKLLLEKGKLALTDGEEFGPGGKGYVRLNFACPKSILEEGLMRMKNALG